MTAPQPVRPDTADVPILRVDNLHKQFGGFKAVDGCSFAVKPGTITGLIGPNGAGKSTLFNLITGVLNPDAGRILFDGADIRHNAPEQIARRGIGRTFQTPRLFFELTVWENLMTAGQGHPGERIHAAVFAPAAVRKAEQVLSTNVWEVLRFLRLESLADEYAANLSGGQRKLLSLGRVLMMKPRLILLDEPAAGVNESLSEELFDHIQTLNRQGLAFVVIEHHMALVMRLSDDIVVMHNGRTLAQGTPEEVQNNQEVLEAYLGGQI